MPCQLLIKPLISIAQQAPETETPILAMAIARIAAVHEPPVKMYLAEFIPNLSRAEPRARTKSKQQFFINPAITDTTDTF